MQGGRGRAGRGPLDAAGTDDHDGAGDPGGGRGGDVGNSGTCRRCHPDERRCGRCQGTERRDQPTTGGRAGASAAPRALDHPARLTGGTDTGVDVLSGGGDASRENVRVSATPRTLRGTGEPTAARLNAAAVPAAARLNAVAVSAAARLNAAAPVRWMDAHPRLWRVLGLLLLAGASWHIVSSFLVSYPDEIWQVDLEVYREAAYSLVNGRQVYEWLTDAPQYLPFTYPPVAAFVGLPMLLLPFRAVGWVWTVVQIVLLWFTTGLAFRPLVERAGARAGLLQGLVAAALIQLQPLQDGIRYGQVNALLVTLCLADVARRRVGWWPRGSLVGIATAIKLTPAVFWVHWLVVRRWRTFAVSVGTAVTLTAAAAMFAPSASAGFWTDALFDPGRLGPNAETANQSIRGVLLRLGPSGGGALTLTWALCVVVVAVLGYALSARLERLGEPVAVVATMGMLAFLLSPVSWIHHMYWGVVAVGALVGDGRRWPRLLAAAATYAVLFSRLPWTGAGLLGRPGWRHALGVVDQQAYCWLGLAVLLALWLLVARGRPPVGTEPTPTGAPDVADAAPAAGADIPAGAGVPTTAVAGASPRRR